MNEIDLNEISIKEKIKAEVERFKKFQKTLLGTQQKIVVRDVDIRNYTKYILKEGSNLEKENYLDA